jgi:hypothetical protein
MVAMHEMVATSIGWMTEKAIWGLEEGTIVANSDVQ